MGCTQQPHKNQENGSLSSEDKQEIKQLFLKALLKTTSPKEIQNIKGMNSFREALRKGIETSKLNNTTIEKSTLKKK